MVLYTSGGKALDGFVDSQSCSDLLVEIHIKYSPGAGKMVLRYLKSMHRFSHPDFPNLRPKTLWQRIPAYSEVGETHAHFCSAL